MRRADLGEGQDDTSKDLANEVILDIICNTINVAVDAFDVTRLNDTWNNNFLRIKLYSQLRNVIFWYKITRGCYITVCRGKSFKTIF